MNENVIFTLFRALQDLETIDDDLDKEGVLLVNSYLRRKY
jgi:hypothetical protein